MSYFQNILFIADNCRILQFLDAKDGSALEKHVIDDFHNGGRSARPGENGMKRGHKGLKLSQYNYGVLLE